MSVTTQSELMSPWVPESCLSNSNILRSYALLGSSYMGRKDIYKKSSMRDANDGPEEMVGFKNTHCASGLSYHTHAQLGW